MSDLQRLADLQDISTFPTSGGWDLTDIPIRGRRVVLEWVARAWLTNPGDLKWNRERGRDIVRLVNADLTDAQVDNTRLLLEVEARRTEFVRDAGVTISYGDGPVVINGEIILVDGGSYPLAVSIDEAGAAIVNFGRMS